MTANPVRAGAWRAYAARENATIERLLRWTYRDQGVLSAGMLGADREQRWLGGGDSLSGFVQLEQLGVRVSSSGGGAGRVHADAETVHSAVLRAIPALGRYIVNVVVWHAFAADRPEWGQHLRPRFEPVWRERAGQRLPTLVWETGKLRDWLPNGVPAQSAAQSWRPPDSFRASRPLLCPVEQFDDPRQVASERAEYTRWRAALFAIAADLVTRDALTRFALDLRLPPEAPWAVPGEAADAGRCAATVSANQNFFRKNA